MPPKKQKKEDISKKKIKKDDKAINKADIIEEIEENIDEENIDEEMEYEEEQFFNEDSYNNFIRKYEIQLLDNLLYIDNDIHKKDIVVPNDKRITSEIMTMAEYTRVISERAKQIYDGSPIFTNVENEFNPIRIAEKEVREKKCPLKISRYITRNVKEEFSVNEMVPPFQ
jgi:DNA-directed RNA polymerase I, II, and III subunit RPABC2